jgi:hypothetical protein
MNYIEKSQKLHCNLLKENDNINDDIDDNIYNDNIDDDIKYMTRSEFQELLTCSFSNEEICKHKSQNHDLYCEIIQNFIN